VREGKLSVIVDFRSSDCSVGLPWNIAQYALLTYMIAHVTGLGVGKIGMKLADAHIYVDNVQETRKLFERSPRAWPRLKIVGAYKSIDDFRSDSFKLEGYYPHPALNLKMVV
jgi:thymidylate synthase